jgi:ribosomal protein S18 acetylase RimI-like enzyme
MTERVAAETVTVCRVAQSDWQVQRAVRLAMLLDAPAAYGSTFEREFAMTEQDWHDRLAIGVAWLAMDGSLPVGAVKLMPARGDGSGGEGDTHSLVGMWVAAHARGRGVADALVDAVVAESRSLGLRRVTLDVEAANARAIGFYERYGFVRTGRTSTVPHQGTPEFEMELVVAS